MLGFTLKSLLPFIESSFDKELILIDSSFDEELILPTKHAYKYSLSIVTNIHLSVTLCEYSPVTSWTKNFRESSLVNILDEEFLTCHNLDEEFPRVLLLSSPPMENSPPMKPDQTSWRKNFPPPTVFQQTAYYEDSLTRLDEASEAVSPPGRTLTTLSSSFFFLQQHRRINL